RLRRDLRVRPRQDRNVRRRCRVCAPPRARTLSRALRRANARGARADARAPDPNARARVRGQEAAGAVVLSGPRVARVDVVKRRDLLRSLPLAALALSTAPARARAIGPKS